LIYALVLAIVALVIQKFHKVTTAATSPPPVTTAPGTAGIE
jgi:hypothetical protein